LWLLDSGRLTMANCTAVDRARAECYDLKEFADYLWGTKLFLMIQDEGWDSTYPLCHAYVQRVHRAWVEGTFLDISEPYNQRADCSDSEDEHEEEKIKGAMHVLSQSLQEKWHRTGEHSRPLHQQKLQRRRHRQHKQAELKSCKDRHSRRVQRLQDRDHKALSQGASFLHASYGYI